MKKVVTNIIYLILIPVILYLGIILYRSKQYNLVSLLIVILAMIPFFVSFEKKDIKVEKLVLIAAFTAITTLSRLIFNVIPIFPGFNPVAAIIILIAITFGKEIGFMVGALTALISNNYLSHGPWTPFQMFSWGIVGYIGGLFKNILKRYKVLLLIYGVFGAVLYSLLMDVYSVLSFDNAFIINRFVAFVGLSLPFTITYIIANFLFLLLFSVLFLERLDRIVGKYEII